MLDLLNFSGRRRLPSILQTEAAECGLACLAMIACFHGQGVDLPALRRRHPISLKGTTLAQLMAIADQLDLTARPVKVELEDLDKLALPAVLHWDFNHFVVLKSASTRGLTIHDPARGPLQVRLEDASKHFTGVALELSPAAGFQRVERRNRIGVRDLFGRLDGVQVALLQVLLLAAALEVFAIAAPLYTQIVVDNAVVSADRDLLTVLGIGFLLLGLLQTLFIAGRSWLVTVLGTSANYQLLGKLFQHLLQLPMSYFEKRHLGDVASRFESVNVIQRTLSTAFLEGIMDGVMSLVILAMMALYSVRLTMIVCAAAAAYALVRRVLYGPLRRAQEEQILHGARQQTHLLETMRGMQSIKLFNRQTQRRALFQNRLVDTFNAGIRVQQIGIGYNCAHRAVFCIENVAVIWAGALLVLDTHLSVGMLIAFLAYKQQFITRVGALIDKAVDLKMLGLHAERVADVALHPTESSGIAVLRPGRDAGHELELRHVQFRYSPSDPVVLDDINLRIAPGESVAIVGPSGCGKTTLVKVLLGLLPPTAGEVLLGGVPVGSLGTARLRELIGTVMQEDHLFAGSIADNISFFDPEADQVRIERCATIAAVHDEIAAMAMGYNTLVGDMGAALSGGQRQRILLARALYKQPKILVLDEATSHLDVVRERTVNEAIRALAVTRIIIAHRPETIASADRVIRLSGGTAQSLVTLSGKAGAESRAPAVA